MRKSGWTDEWNEEWAQVMEEVMEVSPDSGQRREAFLIKLADAIQAQRPWAMALEQDCLRRGATTEVARYAKARMPRQMFAHDGKILTEDAIVGLNRTGPNGEKWVAQELITVASWEELKVKRRSQITLEHSYGIKTALYDKLLALEVMAPEAENPSDACRVLGINMTDYLIEGDGIAA